MIPLANSAIERGPELLDWLDIVLPLVAFFLPTLGVVYLRILPVIAGDRPVAWVYSIPLIISGTATGMGVMWVYSQPPIRVTPTDTAMWLTMIGLQIVLLYFSLGLLPALVKRSASKHRHENQRPRSPHP